MVLLVRRWFLLLLLEVARHAVEILPESRGVKLGLGIYLSVAELSVVRSFHMKVDNGLCK